MQIREPISVMVSFGLPYRMKPVRFRWSGKSFEVKEITYSWRTKAGQTDIYHFSVTDGGTLFELAFDSGSLLWSIESLEA